MGVKLFIIVYIFHTDHQKIVKSVCKEGERIVITPAWSVLFQKLDTSHCHDIFIFLDTQLDSNLICAGVIAEGSASFPLHLHFGK